MPSGKFCDCGTKVRHRIYDRKKNETYLKCPVCGKEWTVKGKV